MPRLSFILLAVSGGRALMDPWQFRKMWQDVWPQKASEAVERLDFWWNDPQSAFESASFASTLLDLSQLPWCGFGDVRPPLAFAEAGTTCQEACHSLYVTQDCDEITQTRMDANLQVCECVAREMLRTTTVSFVADADSPRGCLNLPHSIDAVAFNQLSWVPMGCHSRHLDAASGFQKICVCSKLGLPHV